MAIAALIGIAERFLNRDHAWRTTLAEATSLYHPSDGDRAGRILGEAARRSCRGRVRDPGAGDDRGCWGFYLIGREVNRLRPLIGLRARAKARKRLPGTGSNCPRSARRRLRPF